MGRRKCNIRQLGDLKHTFKCVECGWSGSETATRLHNKIHHNGQPVKIAELYNKCVLCGFETQGVNSLKEHIKKKHPVNV